MSITMDVFKDSIIEALRAFFIVPFLRSLPAHLKKTPWNVTIETNHSFVENAIHAEAFISKSLPNVSFTRHPNNPEQKIGRWTTNTMKVPTHLTHKPSY